MRRSTFLCAAAAAASATLLSACGPGPAADEAEGGDQAADSGTGAPGESALTAAHIGGPTTVLEIGGARLLIDPTFDGPRTYESGLEKTEGPAMGPEEIGDIDAVLLTHDQHDDNLDESGRALLADMPVVYSTPGARERLGDPVTGMESWDSEGLETPEGAIEVTAVPALHGPDGEDRGEDGEVTGFVLSGDGVPVTYVSGDNASVEVARQAGARIEEEIGPIDTAVLFAGAARTPQILDNAPLTLTSENAAEVAEELDPRQVVPAHTDGWNIYSEDIGSLEEAFAQKGIDDLLVDMEPAGETKDLS